MGEILRAAVMIGSLTSMVPSFLVGVASVGLAPVTNATYGTFFRFPRWWIVLTPD